MKRQKISLSDRLAELDQEEAAQDMAMWGGVAAGFQTDRNSLVNSPKYQQIVALLHETPLLVAPCLRWLQQKRAQLATVQLQALYTPEELEQMVRDLPKETKHG
jgi:hypothetical protein